MIYAIIVLGIILVIETIFIIWLTRNNKAKKEIENTVAFFRELWGKFVFYAIATSIIGLFLCSIIFDKNIKIGIINNWIGIILGLVALVIGIISLFLSFYNLDQANKTQEKTVKLIEEFKINIVDRMNKLQMDVEKKIDETSEKTQATINGGFKKTDNNPVKSQSSDIKWEDNNG